MQVILDSPFARPGSAPMWGAGRKESSGTGLGDVMKRPGPNILSPYPTTALGLRCCS